MEMTDFPRFLVLGVSDDGTVRIAVHPARAETRVRISVGPHAANAGGEVGLDVLLDETRTQLAPGWKEQFAAARLTWLEPHLVRLAEGRNVKESRLIKAHEQKHGYAPDIEY